jgi:hypothetical protein
MAAHPGKILGMKSGAASSGMFLAGALFFLGAVAENRAQQTPTGRATDFTSEAYFEPPNQQQVKMRFSGGAAVPLPGGLLEVSQLKIEKFATDGRTELVVQAPECVYAPLDGVATSAGRLDLRTGDGRLLLEGEGFLFNQNAAQLVVSNHVHTVIKNFFKSGAP